MKDFQGALLRLPPKPWRRFILTFTLALAAGSAAGAPAAPGSFIYCYKVGTDIEVFAGKPAPDDGLEFGFENWQGQRLIGVSGTAARYGQQWRYQDNMNAETAFERCRLDIARDANGALRVEADPEATCQGQGGQGTVIGVVRFPPNAYEGPVTNELDADKNFDSAGRCWQKD